MLSQLVVDFRTPSRSTRLVTRTARLIWILLILLLVLIWNAVRARIVWLVGSPWLIWIWLVWPSWLIWLRFQWLTDSTIRSFTLLPMSNNLSRLSTVLNCTISSHLTIRQMHQDIFHRLTMRNLTLLLLSVLIIGAFLAFRRMD
jgi:hypothetical protein